MPNWRKRNGNIAVFSFSIGRCFGNRCPRLTINHHRIASLGIISSLIIGQINRRKITSIAINLPFCIGRDAGCLVLYGRSLIFNSLLDGFNCLIRISNRNDALNGFGCIFRDDIVLDFNDYVWRPSADQGNLSRDRPTDNFPAGWYDCVHTNDFISFAGNGLGLNYVAAFVLKNNVSCLWQCNIADLICI